jgi:DNA excision repair protein ERCC-2
MKVVICNYQWILHPFIRKSFLKFIGKELKDCIIVIDECHNVIDVATDINSQRISPYSLKLCLKDLEVYYSPKKMQHFANFLLGLLNKRKKKLKNGEFKINPRNFLNKIIQKLDFNDLTEFSNFIKDIHSFSFSIHEEKTANGLISRDFVGAFAEFWLDWLKNYQSDSYFFSYNVRPNNERKTISLEIVSLDPRDIIIPVIRESYACLNLSGTVNPYVFSNLMGFKESGKRYKAILSDSPFEKKNIKAIITEGVDTRRENRNPFMYGKIVQKISEVLYCTPANVGIFCASYRVLNGLLDNGIREIVKKNQKKLFIEKPGLSATENAYLVEDFKSCATARRGGGVLLGVCGGRNSEGEDYPGDFMNSIIVAGFPYHLPTPRVQAKIEYYNKVFNNQGWNFAYLYPAIQRANQASGRPIRKLDDKGAIIFMDSRFKRKYKWISKWIQKELEIIPDKQNSIIQSLYPFWNS